jgi:serine/threonine-protein kinase OSR1/STK39
MSRISRVRSSYSDDLFLFPLEKSEYELLHAIGCGDFSRSEVYAARCAPNGKTVAARLIDLELSMLDFDQLRRETAFWSICHHPNAIQYYGSFLAESILWSLMEYMDGGSVADALQFAHPTGFHDQAVIATILKHVLLFLSCFHAQHQAHRAICTHNILLSTQGDVKLGDFGSAARMRDAEKCDIWSVGATAIAMATGHRPLEIRSGLAGPGRLGAQLSDFVRQCMNRDPAKRPSAAALLKHPFLKAAKGKAYLAELMAGLPPLTQRLGHGTRERTTIEARVRTAVVFDFDPREEEEEKIEIGRFAAIVRDS